MLCAPVGVYTECTGVQGLARPGPGAQMPVTLTLELRAGAGPLAAWARHYCTLELRMCLFSFFRERLGMLLYLLHQARIHNIVSVSVHET